MNSEIEARIRKYLNRDRNGIRKELLRVLLEDRKFTTEDIYKKLVEKGFDISVRGISAMVGLISARLGVLKTELGEKNRYYLKREYVDMVKKILEEYDSK